MTVPRQTIDELITKYTLEPSVVDVFVEGDFDQTVVEAILRSNNRRDAVVYVIDNVDIGQPILEKYGLTRGEKQEVIALMHELAAANVGERFRGLVDRDLDDLFETRVEVTGLKWTPNCCLEGLWYNEEFIKRYFEAANVRLDNFEKFFATFVDVLADLFSFRLAARALEWQISWYDYHRKDVTVTRSKITFDRSSCISKLLQPTGHGHDVASFSEAAVTWKEKLTAEPLRGFHGHDLFGMLTRTVDKAGTRKALASPDALVGLVVYDINQRPHHYEPFMVDLLN